MSQERFQITWKTQLANTVRTEATLINLTQKLASIAACRGVFVGISKVQGIINTANIPDDATADLYKV